MAKRSGEMRCGVPWRAFVAATILALLATACGGSGEDASAADGPASGSSPTPNEESSTPDRDCVGDCEPPPEIVQAAQEEGRLVMYSGLSASSQQEVSDAFSEKYGIEIEYLELPVAGAIERVYAEFQSGRVTADLTLASPGIFDAWLEEGVIMPFDESQVPNLAALAQDARPEDGYFMWGGPVYTLAWNEEQLPEGEDPPDSYCGLTDPKWNGKVGVTAQPGGAQWIHLDMIRQVCGDDYWSRMADNGLVQFPGTTNATQSLAAGEYAVLVSSVPYLLDPLVQQGAPLAYTLPEDGVTVSTRWLGIVADAPHPNAALVYANFVLSTEVQTMLYTGDSIGYSVLPEGAVDGAVSPPGRLEFADLERAAEVEPAITEQMSG